MRYNGNLQYLIVTGSGGVNEYGEPEPQQESWSTPIPCSIKTNHDNRLGTYEDGEYRQASFIILIELSTFDAKRVRLERLGENLGEYRVKTVEPLTTVGRTKIIV